MGQHRFTAPAPDGRMLDICINYDLRLNYFFLDVEPVNKPKANADLRFNSMVWSVKNKQKSPGFDYLHQLTEKVAELGFKVPRGFWMLLDDEQKRPEFHQVRNNITRWPLKGHEARRHDRWVDKKIINDVLVNDEESADEDILIILLDAVVTFDKVFLKNLIEEERPKCLRDPFHFIPWYLLTDDRAYEFTEPSA